MKSGEISIMASKVGDCQNQSQNMWWNPAGTMFINFNSAAGQMEKSHWENPLTRIMSDGWQPLKNCQNQKLHDQNTLKI